MLVPMATAPCATASLPDSAAVTRPGMPSVSPWFTYPLWPPPDPSSTGELATPTWPPPAPLRADASLVHPVWPPERRATVPKAGVEDDDEPLPPLGAPVRVDELPRVFFTPAPIWPDDSGRRAPITVTVLVAALVDSHGRVRDARVTTKPASDPVLPDLQGFSAAAMATARGFVFRPARRNGRPVPVWVTVPIRYHRE